MSVTFEEGNIFPLHRYAETVNDINLLAPEFGI